MEFYKIGRFSRIIDIHKTTLRKWHEKGILVPDFITPTGIRIYTDEQVEKYRRGEYGIPREKKTREDEVCE